MPGSFQRGPTTHQVGVHADYTFHFAGQELAAIVRVFNLFNEQKGTDFDQGFELNGAPAFIVLAVVVLYFIVFRRFLGGTLFQRLLGAR